MKNRSLTNQKEQIQNNSISEGKASEIDNTTNRLSVVVERTENSDTYGDDNCRMKFALKRSSKMFKIRDSICNPAYSIKSESSHSFILRNTKGINKHYFNRQHEIFKIVEKEDLKYLNRTLTRIPKTVMNIILLKI